MNSDFVIKTDEYVNLLELRSTRDKWKMNWVKEQGLWGKIEAPDGIQTEKKYCFTENLTLEESFVFKNTSKFPIYFRETDLGIFLSLPDNYTSAEECMKYHCNVHLWCGYNTSWIKALRMGGDAPHLGMVLQEGSLRSYSIQRDEHRSSNDRGCFILHPELTSLFPGETYTVKWEWFWFEDEGDFELRRRKMTDCPIVQLEKSTYFIGETANFVITGKEPIKECSIRCRNGQEISVEHIHCADGYLIKVIIPFKKAGECEVEVEINGKKTVAVLYVCEPLEKMVEKRCIFIVRKQQEFRGALTGAYLIYDKESKRRFYSHLDDHNGARERLAMGSLIALWLQVHRDQELEESLEQYIAYVYREIFCSETGDTCNDIAHDLEWDRLYNYPWMAIFLMEVFEWKGDISYLVDAYKTLIRYYQKGGDTFYPIGLPVSEIVLKLESNHLHNQADELKKWLNRHAEYVLEQGLSFPKSEVNYEQSIAAPAVSILIQAYEQTKRNDFLFMSQKMLEVLLLFNGNQPDYHLFENAIRHWDGFWFGKKRMLGDTFPHYWSVLSGVEMIRYGKAADEDKFITRACNSLRGCLNLFDDKGFGSCAFVYPESVNGKKAHYYDPWANDQDWALYYAWKYREITEGEAQ